MTATETTEPVSLESSHREWLKKISDVLNVAYQSNNSVVAVDGTRTLAGPNPANKLQTKKKVPPQTAQAPLAPEPTGMAVPRRPMYAGGELRYQGITDYLKDPREKNLARDRAKKVRDKIQALDDWARHVDEKSKAFLKQQQAQDAVIYNVQKVQGALEKDLNNGSFRKLSKQSKGKLGDELASYQKASSSVDTYSLQLKAQAWRLVAAQAMVEKCEKLVQAYETQKERDKEQKEKAKLEADLKAMQGAASAIIGAASDPIGAAKKFGIQQAESLAQDMLVEIMGGASYKKRIKEIGDRIDNLNKKLDSLQIGALKADLNSAINTVKAVETDCERDRGLLDQAKKEQGQAIDHLADLEIDHPGTTTAFRELQKYYQAVDAQGNKMLETSREYDGVMIQAQQARPAISEIRQSVNQDTAIMDRIYQNPTELPALVQRDQKDAIVGYTQQMDQWYQAQVDDSLAAQRIREEALLRNGHFAMIGPMISQVQQVGLNNVQRDENITR